MRRLFKFLLIMIILLVIPLSAHAILVTQTWKITLTTAGTAQNIFDPSFPNIRYVPAFRVFNLSSAVGTNNIYIGGSDVSALNAEPIYPQWGISFANEQTLGQNEKMFDLQQAYFDADSDGTEIIIMVMYDDGD